MPEEECVAGQPWGCEAGRKGALAWLLLLGLLRHFCPVAGFDTTE